MSYADVTQLEDSLRARVEREVRPGEHVTWIDQPIPGRSWRAAVPLVLFGIPWTAFSLFWTWGALQATHGHGAFDLAFAAFGLPFIGVGLGLLSSPYWIVRQARRTLYVLTDRRAIILASAFGRMRVRSFEPSALGNLYRTEAADGSGDLVFATNSGMDSKDNLRQSPIGFAGIADVRGAEDRVRALCQLGASRT